MRLYGQTLASCGFLIYACFILIHHSTSASYLVLTWICERTCEYSLCKLSRLQFVLSCDYKNRAVLALRWHVITMACMTTMLDFLELLGAWLFSLAVSHLKQLRHSVCFVIESNKQDKLVSKQWRRVGCCRMAQVLLHTFVLMLNISSSYPAANSPVHMYHNINKLIMLHGILCTFWSAVHS